MLTRDRLIPAAAGLAIIAVAVMVMSLLNSAVDDGTRALQDAKVAQVQTTASTFNARTESIMGSVGGLGALPWELTTGSTNDAESLQPLAGLFPEANSGFFLVDGSDTITSGVLLRSGRLGSTFDAPGWATAKAALASAPAVVLPVASSGVTTELPSFAFATAIRGSSPTSVRGAFIFEQALTIDSAFNEEIRGLGDDGATTATWRFLDSNGTVVASTLPTGLGSQVSDARLRDLDPGLHIVGDEMAISADVPAVGWRVVFTQNEEEFAEPLAAPLRSAGLILVILLLAVGLTLTIVLSRRLRQAREEERRLLELSRSQDEFISVVSHELRTPVSGVLGFLQTSLDHWDAMSDEDRHHAVRRAFTNARRLQAMTRDVLDTESIESGRYAYDRHPIDLGEEISIAVDAFDIGSAQPVTVTLPTAPVIVDADPDRIQQVLANLLDNALKSSTSNVAVTVTLEQVDTVARITVEDHGAGIDPDQMERIFDKFVRGRSGTVTGTGLGLYICRRIVTAHEGRIWAESRPGEPTRFVVELPSTAPVAQ